MATLSPRGQPLLRFRIRRQLVRPTSQTTHDKCVFGDSILNALSVSPWTVAKQWTNALIPLAVLCYPFGVYKKTVADVVAI